MTSLKGGVKMGLMKKLSLYIFLVLMWCNVLFAQEFKTLLKNKDYSTKSYNDNIVNYNWKPAGSFVAKSGVQIYYLKKGTWLLSCAM